MGQRGGYRENAGRPTGTTKAPLTKEAELVRKAVSKRVKKDVKPVLDALIVSALGFWYEENMPKGKKRIYKTKPDVAAAKYLFDQVIGKATEKQEISGPDGAPIKYDVSGMETKDLNEALKKILKK